MTPRRNDFAAPRGNTYMVDPVLVSMVIMMLVVVFGVYLFLRRIATGFKEGVEEAKRKQ